MRYLGLTVAVLAAFLCAISAPVWAQGEFPLKWQLLGPGDEAIGMIAGNVVVASPDKPACIKAMPQGVAAGASCFVLTVGAKEYAAVLEAGPPAKLYVDTAGTGDLSAVKPLTAGEPEKGQAFGTVEFPPAQKDQPPTRISIRLLSPKHLMVSPAGCMTGEVKLGDASYRVSLVDNDGDGQYGKVLEFPVARDKRPEFDTFAIDLNKDGQFDSDFMAGGEIMPLLPGICVNGAYYSIKPGPGGATVKFEKVEPKFGTIDAGSPDAALTVIGRFGMLKLSGLQGKWQAPEGQYAAVVASLTKTDAAGVKWMLTAQGSVGKLETLDVRAGETTAAKFGTPLMGKVTAAKVGEGVISIGYSLAGQAGEEYAPGAEKNGERTAAPKVKVLDEAGKVLAEANFEYG